MKTCKEESIGRLLYVTAQTMTQHAEKVLKPYDLTVEQLQLLKNMDADTSLSQQQLCAIVQKSAANVTRILDRLERKAYVRREKNPEDRRSILLFLTDRGRDLVEEVSTLLENFSEQMTRGISQEEQQLFFRLLYTIQDNLSGLSK